MDRAFRARAHPYFKRGGHFAAPVRMVGKAIAGNPNASPEDKAQANLLQNTQLNDKQFCEELDKSQIQPARKSELQQFFSCKL